MKLKLSYLTGIDIGSGSLHAVQFKSVSGKPVLRALLHRSVGSPETMTTDGSLLAALRAIRAAPRFTGRRVLAHLPPKLLSSFPIRFHLARHETVEGAILRETRKYLSFPIEEAVVDYPSLRTMTDEEGPGYQATVVCVRRSDLQRFMEVFRQAGLVLEVVDVNVASLLRLHRLVSPGIGGQVMLCSVGEMESAIAVVDAEGLLAHRTIPWGIQPLVNLLLERLKVLADSQQARDILRHEGLAYDERGASGGDAAEDAAQAGVRRAIYQIASPHMDRLIHELHEIIAYVRAEMRTVVLTRIDLCGYASFVRSLDRYVHKRIGIPVHIVNPAERFSPRDERVLPDPAGTAGYTLAMGLALRTVSWLWRDINLVPEDVIYPRRVTRHALVWAAALGFVLAAAVVSYLTLTARARFRTHQFASASASEKDLRTILAQLQQTQTELQRLATVRVIRRNDAVTRILRNLSATLMDRTWLTEVAIARHAAQEETAISLTGLSLSNADLGTFLSRVSQERAFGKVTLRYSRDADNALAAAAPGRERLKLIEFKIDCIVSDRTADRDSPPPASGAIEEGPAHGA